MARMQIPTETSTWLLQAKDFLYQARRLKPGPERNDLRQTAKVLREIARLEAASEQALGRDWRQRAGSGGESAVSSGMPQRQVTMRKERLRKRAHMAPPD
jgi:hypothetical protein